MRDVRELFRIVAREISDRIDYSCSSLEEARRLGQEYLDGDTENFSTVLEMYLAGSLMQNQAMGRRPAVTSISHELEYFLRADESSQNDMCARWQQTIGTQDSFRLWYDEMWRRIVSLNYTKRN